MSHRKCLQIRGALGATLSTADLPRGTPTGSLWAPKRTQREPPKETSGGLRSATPSAPPAHCWRTKRYIYNGLGASVERNTHKTNTF